MVNPIKLMTNVAVDPAAAKEAMGVIDPAVVRPIENVALCLAALKKAIDRGPQRHRVVPFFGPSGFGKSYAACFAANTCNCIYICLDSNVNKTRLFRKFVRALGLGVTGMPGTLMDAVVARLRDTDTPIIVDEADYLCQKDLVDSLRDLCDLSGVACLIIGEEKLPNKLNKWPRFTGRVFDWVQAVPVSRTDAQALIPFYSPQVAFADDLLDEMVKQAKGSVRCVTDTLTRLEEIALPHGIKKLDLAAWIKLGSPALKITPPPVRTF